MNDKGQVHANVHTGGTSLLLLRVLYNQITNQWVPSRLSLPSPFPSKQYKILYSGIAISLTTAGFTERGIRAGPDVYTEWLLSPMSVVKDNWKNKWKVSLSASRTHILDVNIVYLSSQL